MFSLKQHKIWTLKIRSSDLTPAFYIDLKWICFFLGFTPHPGRARTLTVTHLIYVLHIDFSMFRVFVLQYFSSWVQTFSENVTNFVDVKRYPEGGVLNDSHKHYKIITSISHCKTHTFCVFFIEIHTFKSMLFYF